MVSGAADGQGVTGASIDGRLATRHVSRAAEGRCTSDQRDRGNWRLPRSRPLITVLGVKYLHLRVQDGTDLYVTEYGLPFTKCLMPENHWADDAWMKEHGAGCRAPAPCTACAPRTVDGRSQGDRDQVEPDGPGHSGRNAGCRRDETAEFNSPFMEFSLVLEMRGIAHESPGRLYTHKPLAIYVPRKFVQAEQLGRRRHKMEAIQRSHDEIPIDWNRNYAVIYEWLKGIDAVEACRDGSAEPQTSWPRWWTSRPRTCSGKGSRSATTSRSTSSCAPTPERPADVEDRHGNIAVRTGRLRTAQADAGARGAAAGGEAAGLPGPAGPSVRTARAVPRGADAGTDHGRRLRLRPGGEHRRGAVGRGPRPDAVRLLPAREVAAHAAHADQRVAAKIYETVTKDNVHLVWRVSRVGQIPDADPFVRREKRILDYGYNSPFEEFSIAMELSRKGIETTYPRAIYMTGHRSTVSSLAGRRQPLRKPRRPADARRTSDAQPATRVRDASGATGTDRTTRWRSRTRWSTRGSTRWRPTGKAA